MKMKNEIPEPDQTDIVILRTFVGETEIDQEAFTKATIIIGRDPYTDIYLEDPMVSRVHASIQRQGSQLTLTDLSSNGTIVNGNAVKTTALRHGDSISAGRFRVQVGIHSENRLMDEQIARSKGPLSDEDQTIRNPNRT